jgi:outer membrane protein OmpA-like peptidoglycan-associated protein
MQKSLSTEQVESEEQIEQVRTLILGKNSQLVTDTIKKEARSIVSNVLTEALHDRQKKDGSVNKVLLPLVEDSVEHSVAHNSERLVSSLYPLMGSLVRKSVTAFLTDFMEKTNQLIDNSLTIKGLKWRIKAWQAGVTFAQYVASQTFVYRVEHVFLIHRETGLLLNSVDLNNSGNSDADLISSMLTAINDFVGDSFLENEDGLKEQLQTVTTDNFNLLIKPGPSALVVAAVTGNPPQKVSNQLQLTLEDIHSLYNDELNQFDGDNQAFGNAETLLLDCLLSEQKMPESVNRKKPWFAWFIVFVVILLTCFQTLNWWGRAKLKENFMKIDFQPGVVVNHIEIQNDKEVMLDILRDPDAISVNDWLLQNNLTVNQLVVNERLYQSLEPEILKVRAQQILSKYSDLKATWQAEGLNLSGTLELIKSEKLLYELSNAGFTVGKNLTINELKLPTSTKLISDKSVKHQIFVELVGRVSSMQLNFPVASDVITPDMQLALQRIHQNLIQLNTLADDLELSFGLVIMGSSDNSGNKVSNTILSLQRAQNTEKALQQLGVNKDQMFVTGLGQVELIEIENTSRNVLFNILYARKESLMK